MHTSVTELLRLHVFTDANFNDIFLKLMKSKGWAQNSLCSQGWKRRPLWIQSFEYNNLYYMRNEAPRELRTVAPTIYLIDGPNNPVDTDDARFGLANA